MPLQRITLLLMTMLLAVGAVDRAPAQPTAKPDGILLVPDEIDIGLQPTRAVVHRTVWLINTEDKAITVLGAKGSCGCTVLVLRPQTVAPGSGIKVPLRVTAPGKAATSKAVSVTFDIQDRPPLKLPVRMETEGERADTGRGVVADPAEVDLGPVKAGELVSASARLVNTADEPRIVQSAKASCGCTRVIDFEPITLAPGDEADVHLEVDVPGTTGRLVSKDLTFVIGGRGYLKVPVRIRAGHPMVDAVKRHLAESVTTASYRYGDFNVRDNTVTAIAWDSEHTTPQARVVCRMNDTGHVESMQLETIRTPSPAANEAY